jgi:hypothetical protein
MYGKRSGVYRDLVWKPERNRSLRSFRSIGGYYIKIDLQEVGCEALDWIDLARVGTGGGHFHKMRGIS